jgi:hypothetical protein
VVSSLKGVEYNAKRWNKRDQEIAELSALKTHEPVRAQRYDNDFPTGRDE